MTEHNNPPACSVCGEPSVKLSGHQWLCAKHYRFGQMRATARRHGKTVPTREELNSMSGVNLICPDCGRKMNWLASDGKDSVATLQHYRDGMMDIVCLSCNSRHASMPGDSYRDMPKDHKMCSICNEIKHSSEYQKDLNAGSVLRRKSACASCCTKKAKEWRTKNRDKYNQSQREYRAKRKAEGNPVRRSKP